MPDQDRKISSVFAHTLYDGMADAPLQRQLITIKNGRIATVQKLESAEEQSADTLVADIVAPGFIDMQINGAVDIQFNEEPTADAIARIAAGARKGGTAHILPTFITAPDSNYGKAISAANDALETDVPGVLGVHLEGPFLSPERPGIHPPQFIRTLEKSDIDTIKQAKGTLLLTLAPEHQKLDLITELVDAGIHVFAGHSNATAADMNAAIDAGVSGVTHLFNAQSQIAGREPGVVGCALMRSELHAGIIADGFHVHPQNLAMAAELMGERLCLVTDAMKTLGGSATAFDLYGTPVTLSEGCLRGPDGRLAGAHLAMDQAARNAITMMNVSPAQALRMASGNPARALGLADELGSVTRGFRASMTVLNQDFEAAAVIVDGDILE